MMGRVAGVDGCRAGLICVVRDSQIGPIETRIAATAADLISLSPTLDVLAIDIPIGLPDAGRRQCDELARRLLGSPGGRSVFPSPIRPALHAKTRIEASEITRRIDGRKVSAQAWGIYPKIRDIDEVLRQRPSLQRLVREVHPEVSFRAWNGSQPMKDGKKTLDGMIARLNLVQGYFGSSAFRDVRDAVVRKDAGDDDILDAFAALWTAERIARGEATTLPDNPPLDSCGLSMEIVF